MLINGSDDARRNRIVVHKGYLAEVHSLCKRHNMSCSSVMRLLASKFGTLINSALASIATTKALDAVP